MNDKSLVPHASNNHPRSSLRAMFNQYLQISEGKDNFSWKSITTRDGLPHNWIYDLFQDSRGRVWVGTWGGGLARLEEDKWRCFSKADGLHCNEVTCIREDPQGRIWLATDNGLNMMDGDEILDAGLRGKSLLNITFDQKDQLWAGCWRAAHSGGGLFCFDGHKWEAFTSRDQLPGLEILKVFVDSRGWIWAGTYERGIGAGVGCYDGSRWQSYSTKTGLVHDCVYSMFEDPAGNIWFGTVGGISILNGRTWNHITEEEGLVDNRVYSMLIDSQKKMWFGTENGVSQFDGINWKSFTKEDGLVENLVRSIIETDDNCIWFGTYPYTRGLGGISIAKYEGNKDITDQILNLLPGSTESKKLGPKTS